MFDSAKMFKDEHGQFDKKKKIKFYLICMNIAGSTFTHDTLIEELFIREEHKFQNAEMQRGKYNWYIC